MAKITETGLELVTGISIPWTWFDGILIGIIEKGEVVVNTLVTNGVIKCDAVLQALVDDNNVQFDNVGKDMLCKAVTLAFVKQYMPELLPNP